MTDSPYMKRAEEIVSAFTVYHVFEHNGEETDIRGERELTELIAAALKEVPVARTNEIIEYCEPHLEMMWAARIVGILLNCDFRSCKAELKKYREVNT